MDSTSVTSPVGSPALLPSGYIRFEVDSISKLDHEGRSSHKIEVAELPWRLFVCKRSGYLAVGLEHRASDSNIWSMTVTAAITLLNEDPSQHVTKKFNKLFDCKIADWGFSQFISWSSLICENNGFVRSRTIIMEVRFTLSNIMGIRIAPRVDFTDADDPRSDLTILIDGQKIYVNKGILALHSPVFNAMFYGQFAEKNKDEIELKDIDRLEFIEMLRVIYPSCAKITDANAEYLLKLGDQFQIKMVIDQVEQFVIGSNRWKIDEKLQLSDQYRLVQLQEYCFGTFKAVKDVKKMENTLGYKSLSDKAKSALMDKVIKLIE